MRIVVDLIEIKPLGREESTIRINDSEVSIYTDHPFDVYLVDFLKDDGFIELVFTMMVLVQTQ